MELTRRPLNFEIRQVGDPKNRTLEFKGSTAHVDRYGDIIEVVGWDLKNFKANSVFLWAHNYNLPPVGTAKKVFKKDDALVFHVYFPTDEEVNAQGYPATMPTPETVYKLYLAGVMKATSVGFQSLEKEPIIDAKNEGRQTGWRYLKQELYELSAVPVPANPHALMNAVEKGVISQEEGETLQQIFDEDKAAELTQREEVDLRLNELGLAPFEDGLGTVKSLLDLVTELEARIAELTALEKDEAPPTLITVHDIKEAVSQALEEYQKTKDSDYYSLALNPGHEPHGERLSQEYEAKVLKLFKKSLKTANLKVR